MKAQKAFKSVGMLTTKIDPLDDVLSCDEAEILSCNHKRYDKIMTDPYFTDEQWHCMRRRKQVLAQSAHSLST